MRDYIVTRSRGANAKGLSKNNFPIARVKEAALPPAAGLPHPNSLSIAMERGSTSLWTERSFSLSPIEVEREHGGEVTWRHGTHLGTLFLAEP